MTSAEALERPRGLETPDEMADDVEHLAGSGPVSDARRLVAEAVARFSDSDRLQELALALAPPMTRALHKANGGDSRGGAGVD